MREVIYDFCKCFHFLKFFNDLRLVLLWVFVEFFFFFCFSVFLDFVVLFFFFVFFSVLVGNGGLPKDGLYSPFLDHIVMWYDAHPPISGNPFGVGSAVVFGSHVEAVVS